MIGSPFVRRLCRVLQTRMFDDAAGQNVNPKRLMHPHTQLRVDRLV